MRCVECHAETAAAPCSACDQEPRVDGRYALHNPVGGGSSGVVFRGTDLQTGDVVAVKEVMLGGLDNDKARQLATREARVLRELAHPGIPGWRDARTVGIGRSAALYLVQDFVDGQDLQAGLRTKRWSEREVLVLMVEVLDILHYLHTRHPPVVHRDIKPANLVRRTDGQLVLVDFGAVRDALRTARTGGSTVAGTFGYMAPEQFVGHAEPTTDLYALGMTAVALLSREAPDQLHDRAGRLDWERVVSLSSGTTTLLRALLQADPAKRPQSAELVQRHIEALLTADEAAHTHAEPPRPSSSPRADHRPESRPGVALDTPIAARGHDFFAPDLNPSAVVPAGDRPTTEVARKASARGVGVGGVLGLALIKAGLVAVPLLLVGFVATYLLFSPVAPPDPPPLLDVPEDVVRPPQPAPEPAPPQPGAGVDVPVPEGNTMCRHGPGGWAFLADPNRLEEDVRARPMVMQAAPLYPREARGAGEAVCATRLFFDGNGQLEGLLIAKAGCPEAFREELCAVTRNWAREPRPDGRPMEVPQTVRFKTAR